MQTICRLIQLTAKEAGQLEAKPGSLEDLVGTASVHSDVYRYWDGIQFLLERHRPDSPVITWLELGRPIPGDDPSLPDDRLITPAEVTALDAVLADVPPDALAEHYDAKAMDAAKVYPETWESWEEDFDPLGQVLEHYFFLQQFVSRCATAQAALLLHFDTLAEGSV
jgi:hypothetical protein